MDLKFFYPHKPTQSTYEKLMKHLIDYCNENPINRLNDTEYLENIKNKVNNYINLYIIYNDTNFN